jgi:hypothetical protein
MLCAIRSVRMPSSRPTAPGHEERENSSQLEGWNQMLD